MKPASAPRLFSRALLGLVSCSFLSGCSLDIIPVNPAWLRSFKAANRPPDTSPTSPNRFHYPFKFDKPGGYLYDPSKVEISGGVIRLKKIRETQPNFDPTAPTVELTGGVPYLVLESFSEKLGPGNRGKIRYQVTQDRSKWYWHNGFKWTEAKLSTKDTNTADQLASRLKGFHLEVGTGVFLLKAFLISENGQEPVELQEIVVQGLAPALD